MQLIVLSLFGSVALLVAHGLEDVARRLEGITPQVPRVSRTGAARPAVPRRVPLQRVAAR